MSNDNLSADTGKIPNYVRDGIARQPLDVLEAIRAFVDSLIEAKKKPDPDDLDDEIDQSTLQEISGGGSTTVVKKVPCGKDNCSTCPHGPYRYEVSWNGESLDWSYEGPADADA